ncbi:hypothetical protein PBI_MRMAGOO_61 [Mycobacterium phage MrMagoo]|uniref:Uncharacterized protein n=1 Tax=Mycobacterium phage MrMagoo TaxID=1927020 RepID=A0A1L6BYK6_9CAUD|nr:hypothetical protein J4U04_gp061 [Mycobacterium phage MrMagoo]APQ42165.1 hypothetical protein PBI_MRMAGOO_61 [Mycobacterium phage MrMagoo]ARM70241.1 hypothetical protein SEA_GARDENSALSA_61 [Mycobacterium phage GardenSalsa]
MSDEISTPGLIATGGAVVTAGVVGGVTEAIGVPASLILLAMKLGAGNTAVEQWSWWSVFAPVWGGAVATIFFLFLAFVIGLWNLIRTASR